MTALVIEPDDAAQRQLLALLAAHGFRVVPVDEFRYRRWIWRTACGSMRSSARCTRRV